MAHFFRQQIAGDNIVPMTREAPRNTRTFPGNQCRSGGTRGPIGVDVVGPPFPRDRRKPQAFWKDSHIYEPGAKIMCLEEKPNDPQNSPEIPAELDGPGPQNVDGDKGGIARAVDEPRSIWMNRSPWSQRNNQHLVALRLKLLKFRNEEGFLHSEREANGYVNNFHFASNLNSGGCLTRRTWRRASTAGERRSSYCS